MAASPQITHLLADWQAGKEGAKEQLFRVMYDDLRRLAHAQRRNWQGNNTLNTTALVHELYIKLDRQSKVKARDRSHFNMMASKAIRHVLVDYAKTWKRLKRGGAVQKIRLDEADETAFALADQAEEILGIDRALSQLALQSERLVRVVELHFFGGLTYDEIADVLGVTKRTVSRDWTKARAWLRRTLREDVDLDQPPSTTP